MTILEDLKAGRLAVVPREATLEMQSAALQFVPRQSLTRSIFAAMLAASPDRTTALLSLVEGMEARAKNAEAQTAFWKEHLERAAEARALAAEAKVEALRETLATAYRVKAECNDDANHERGLRIAAERERDALREALADAAEAIEHWGTYASSYLQEKHDWAGDIARARALTQEQNNG